MGFRDLKLRLRALIIPSRVDKDLHDELSFHIELEVRSFRRAPLAAFTIVATVAIGLGVVAALFTILNTFLFHVDAVPDVEEIYAVVVPCILGPGGCRAMIEASASSISSHRRETSAAGSTCSASWRNVR